MGKDDGRAEEMSRDDAQTYLEILLEDLRNDKINPTKDSMIAALKPIVEALRRG